MRVKALMTSPAAPMEETNTWLRAGETLGRDGATRPAGVRDGRIVGVLSDREVMTRGGATVTPGVSVEEAARLARMRQTRSLVVPQDDERLGTVTRADLLNALIELLEAETPTSFTHILVPTDFGGAAGRALGVAMELAVRHRARLTLLHILSPSVRAAILQGVPAALRAQLREDRRQRCLARLRSLAFQEGEFGAVPCQVATGDPAAEIVRVAGRTEADLIVMGTRSGGWIRRLIGGGLTAAVARRAPCPVLAVRV